MSTWAKALLMQNGVWAFSGQRCLIAIFRPDFPKSARRWFRGWFIKKHVRGARADCETLGAAAPPTDSTDKQADAEFRLAMSWLRGD